MTPEVRRSKESGRDWIEIVRPFIKSQIGFSESFLDGLLPRIQPVSFFETFTVKTKHQSNQVPKIEQVLDRIVEGSKEDICIVQAYKIRNSTDLRAWGIINAQLLARLHNESYTKHPKRNTIESTKRKESKFKHVTFKEAKEFYDQYGKRTDFCMYWLKRTGKIY